MKKIIKVITLCLILVMFVSCNNSEKNQKNEIADDTIKNTIQPEADDKTDIPSENTDLTEEENKKDTEEIFDFSELEGLEFYFLSGAGAWSTVLNINSDGTFEGTYHDSDMGGMGEGYPNGTLYYCDFSGKFTAVEKVDDYTYKCKIEYINYENELGEEIKEGVRYIYTDAYGLDTTEYINIYVPGKPMDELSDEFLSWINQKYYGEDTPKTLYFYALHNLENQYGFYSMRTYTKSYEFQKELDEVERKESEINYELYNNPNLTQSEMNSYAVQKYGLWDELINYQWGILKDLLDETTMADLKEEQLKWIDEKEKEAIAAGEKYKYGSMEPMERYLTEAKLTKERVYELAEYLE